MRTWQRAVIAAVAALGMAATAAAVTETVNAAGRSFRVERCPETALPLQVRPNEPVRYAGEPAAAARRFLAENAAWLGLGAELAQYQPVAERRSLAGRHVDLELRHAGRPVVNGRISVHLDTAGRVMLAQRVPLLPDPTWPEDFPDRTAALGLAADTFAERVLRSAWPKPLAEKPQPAMAMLTAEQEAYFIEAGRPLAVREFCLATEEPLARWTLWVGGTPLRVLGASSDVWYADGSGRVFQPNPVSYLNDSSLRDYSDGSLFLPAYVDVVLAELAAPDAQGYHLTGPWVQIVSRTDESPLVTPPAETSPVFDYPRDPAGFEAVMAYYWIDSAQRYIRWLGFDTIVNFSLPVDVHGLSGADNSHFVRQGSTRYIAYGDGGVDDAEDADIILHEYGHAIQDTSNPLAFSNAIVESGAIGEGFSDYWAFSQTYDLSVTSGYNPFHIGEWDAKGYTPSAEYLRRVDYDDMRYPEDRTNDIYGDSAFWSTALKNLFLQLGREVADRIVLQSHFLMPTSAQNTFHNGALAMIDADQALYGGAHVFEICQEFLRPGIFSVDDCRAQGPFLETAGQVLVEVEGNGNGIAEPGELVTLAVPIQNTGAAPTGELLVTLAAPDDLVVYRGKAHYAAPAAGDAAVAPGVPFLFRIRDDAACGVSLALELECRFGAHVQRLAYTLTVGQTVDSTLVADDMETGSSLWAVDHGPGMVSYWERVTASYYHAGPTVWRAFDRDKKNDDYLIWGPLDLPAGSLFDLSFWHTYYLESGSSAYDGAVLEASTDLAVWTDLGAAMVEGGYNATVSINYDSPILGRPAWSGGGLGAMTRVRVDLSAWAGQTVWLRFRLACGSSTQVSGGWYVDDVQITRSEPDCEAYDFRAGDLDGNGVIDAADVTLLAALLDDNLAAGEGNFQRNESAADLDDDGRITVRDLALLAHLTD
ncbi:MAG TPA: M36 family metallopeptidase [Acidobacteriota bacterium]|nr:M36 family metallopeptidase [Acidobacteriota bacterium]HQM63953.1 M36 family metallopeptidase [Acidobacteriota bacterium]